MITNLSTRANLVAKIFDGLGWVVVIFGALTAAFVFFGYVSDDEFLTGLFVAALIVAMTAIYWAGISLASCVAGYISNRS